MLIASFILVMSFMAFIQFAMSSWRAGLLRVTATQAAIEARLSTEASRKILHSNDFQQVVAYHKVCPDPSGSSPSKLRAVRMYYSALKSLSGLGRAIAPSSGFGWANREMALCTQYAAAQVAQRLEHNLALATEAGSY